jgi:hypothetical protein
VSGIFTSVSSRRSSYRDSAEAAGRLSLLRRARLRSRTTRVLASPGPPLRRIDDTVVVGVHPVELRGRPPGGSLLGSMDILLAGEATSARPRWTRRSRARLGGGLLTYSLLARLGEGSCRQQG